jgi:general secretion pathway protein G
MTPGEPVAPVRLDYASAREARRSWRETSLSNALIGVYVSVALVALSALFLTPCVFHTDVHARRDLTRGKIGAMKTPLELYRQHVGAYPSSLDDLITVPAGVDAGRWAGPYITNLDDLKDGWDHPLRYKAPGNKNRGQYDLWSAGADGVDGTKDDIGNWK